MHSKTPLRFTSRHGTKPSMRAGKTCLERIRQLIIAACRALWLGRFLPNPNPSYATPAEEEMALWFDRLPLLDAESLLDNEAAVRIYRARERELKRRAEAPGRKRQ